MSTLVTNLICVNCGVSLDASKGVQADVADKQVWMTCPQCGPADGILDFHYDLDAVRSAWGKRPLAGREPNHWRYSELLPLTPESIPHHWQVGWTPVLDMTRLARQLGLQQLKE